MAKKTEEIDPDFIGRPVGGYLSVPTVFDERRIRGDLVRLAATPSLFSKYVAVLRSRFSKATEIKLLDQWAALYQSAKQTVVARTDLDRAVHEHSQLHREYKIKDKEKDLRITELDADIAEADLRRMRAQYAAYELKQSLSQAGQTGFSQPTYNDPQRLEQWYKQARQGIIADHSLSVEEQDQLLAALRVEYQQRRRGFIDI
jgi:hypothetical protein